MSISRRDFIVGCSSAIAAMAGSRVLGLDFAQEGASNKEPILVVVFLRGGIDGLNLIAPVDDKNYLDARPDHLRIGASGEYKGVIAKGTLPTKQDWRFHRECGGLAELFGDGSLAVLHATGLTHGTRSHFESMDLMERGLSDSTGLTPNASGWITRFLAGQKGLGPYGVASFSDSPPDSLVGMPHALAIPKLDDFGFWGGQDQAKAIAALYAGTREIHRSGTAALATLETLVKKVPRNENFEALPYVPAAGVKYPDGELGESLSDVARILKMDLGLRVAVVDFGGWDTHENQTWFFNEQVKHLSNALHSFWNDTGAFHGRMHVLVMSEFGRRLRSNRSEGTDHGHGNAMMVLGQGVRGGKIHGRWPGLETENLDQQLDLAVTTDYRAALAEVLESKWGAGAAKDVFPGLTKSKPIGLFDKR
jgi:uncharacterized protein (DUF1501 family)